MVAFNMIGDLATEVAHVKILEGMMSTTEVVLCHPVRTAIGAYNGSLKGVAAPDLGAVVVRETIARSGLDPAGWIMSFWVMSFRRATV